MDRITGLCVRGGYVLDLEWENHTLCQATVYRLTTKNSSKHSEPNEVMLYYKKKGYLLRLNPGESIGISAEEFNSIDETSLL